MSRVKKTLSNLLAASLLIAFTTLSGAAYGQVVNPGNFEKLKHDTIYKVKARLNPLLVRYCKDACQIINVRVEIDESIPESDDLGFEGIMGEDFGSTLFVSKVTAELQVDDRVTTLNRERLHSILSNNLKNFGTDVDISWQPVNLPQIGQSAAMEEQLKRQIRKRVGSSVSKVIEKYCPEGCVLSQVAVDGKLVSHDDAANLPAKELVRDKTGKAILSVENIDVEVSVDDAIPAQTRKKILGVMGAKTRFVSPVNFDLTVTAFPESYLDRKSKMASASQDPYGLEKLRQTLKIFKELAGTKEIISKSTSTTSAVNSKSSSESLTSSLKEQSKSSALSSSSKQGETTSLEWALYAGGFLLLAGLIAVVVMRFASANRDAKLMMEAAADQGANGEGQGRGGRLDERLVSAEGVSLDDERYGDMKLRHKCEEIREELIGIFLGAPKVAKETFSRLLQEEGIEETSKYVHIFGHMVIFELLNDPNLQRDLYELSEYVHKSRFEFTLQEEYELLQSLRARVTANEIRVLSRKQTDQFDFLTKLDSNQIYNLVVDEKAQIQSIVLTQLDPKRRAGVFDMYEGAPKVELMSELCRADAIPKEYLNNVAKALNKKVTSRPEFDTENLRSSDILLDLMEKSDLEEQRALMIDLQENNPDTARGIKLKLVTLEMLPYLKDGHLLELIIGMEREDLLAFLGGTREHIRDLLIQKAPEELADSWLEDLEVMAGVDEQRLRLVEMKVLGRVRSLANNGAINLLDINDMIFAYEENNIVDDEDTNAPQMSDSSMVA